MLKLINVSINVCNICVLHLDTILRSNLYFTFLEKKLIFLIGLITKIIIVLEILKSLCYYYPSLKV